MTLSPLIDALIKVFETTTPTVKEGHHFSVSRTVSTFAVLYEKARNAVEFRAEHLVRRAAIARILKRRITLDNDPNAIAENLTVELLWAKYIDSSQIDDATITIISHIISKYLVVKQTVFSGAKSKHHGITWDDIIGVASTEIDETIVSAAKREALINYVYQMVRPSINVVHQTPEQLNLLTYIAVERSFAQADTALITYHLIRFFEPTWITLQPHDTEKMVEQFIETLRRIHENTNNPVAGSIAKYLRKRLPPFLLLRDFFFEYGKEARTLIEDPIKFEETLTQIAQKRYQQIGEKVRRGVIRSIIYIFLTKMVLALALEAPVDILIVKRIDYLPLTINLLFPPFLLFLLSSFMTVPGTDNTRRLIERIKIIIYHPEEYQNSPDVFSWHPKHKRPLLSGIFSILYLFTFLISFGAIAFILTKLHFNIASQAIFVFFVALVSLFAYRIRQSAKEYEMIERQGMLEPIVDFFFLPILYAGDLLSKEIAKINFFIFLFDFILEAPLKVIFEVIEEWIRFIRTKKEEII